MDLAVNAGIAVVMLMLTYALMSEGLWGAALMFFNIMFAGLIAFNFYEPLAGLLAKLLAENVSASLAGFADVLCLTLLFVVSLFILRLITDKMAPNMVRFPPLAFHIGRVVFALGGAAMATAIVILIFHTAPVHKKIFGVFDAQSQPPFKLGLDRQWLGFVQHTTGRPFSSYSSENDDEKYGKVNAFDLEGRWLIDHQNARPYGDEAAPGAPK